jgi:hypothetical protein
MPAILATQEAEIRRIMVQSQPWKIVARPCLEKILHTHTHKKRASQERAGEVAQGVGPEFKPQP